MKASVMNARRLLLLLGFVSMCALWGARAEAQYKNGQFGFEAGYFFIGKDSQLTTHNFSVGMRGGFKLTDNVWFTGRAALSFPGDAGAAKNTVVLLHLVPVDVRYYFKTDSFRPFLGVTNSFQILANQEIESSAFWGPGVTGGMELRLRRDLFLGFQADAYWMFVFEGEDAPLVTVTTQLLFFL
jgi:outer membrane protein W